MTNYTQLKSFEKVFLKSDIILSFCRYVGWNYHAIETTGRKPKSSFGKTKKVFDIKSGDNEDTLSL